MHKDQVLWLEHNAGRLVFMFLIAFPLGIKEQLFAFALSTGPMFTKLEKSGSGSSPYIQLSRFSAYEIIGIS